MSTEEAGLPVRAMATAEVLCATYVRHKPYHRDSYYACDRCWGTARSWEEWVSRGENLVERRCGGVS